MAALGNLQGTNDLNENQGTYRTLKVLLLKYKAKQYIYYKNVVDIDNNQIYTEMDFIRE